jgi:plastocyanin
MKNNLKHEIMWWMSRLTIMLTSLFLSFSLASTAYAADIQMGYEGNLVFEPNEVTVNAGETVTFINNALPPHNIIVDGRADLSRESLMFSPGETQEIVFADTGDFNFKCAPHEGAGMKGVIHVK